MIWRNLNPAKDDASVYYSVLALAGDGMEALRAMFPDGEANELNAILFSTSGVHGHYCTIEEVEADMQRAQREGPRDVTFVVIQPRIVCMRYGNAEPRTADDIAFLKKLRASSAQALAQIGMPVKGCAASLEQEARDLLERAGVEDAQSFSAGSLVEIANVLNELKWLRNVAATRERMIADCLPGGSVCDPQQVADALRNWKP